MNIRWIAVLRNVDGTEFKLFVQAPCLLTARDLLKKYCLFGSFIYSLKEESQRESDKKL
jgi:hypothetical protein